MKGDLFWLNGLEEEIDDFEQIFEKTILRLEFLDDNIDRNLMNDRYDDQMAIYGNKIQEKLNNENIFIIGAGALGCEFLKTFSLMGIATNKDKIVTIADNDNIKTSNLNRQFLFKHDNIWEPKSIIASKEEKKMNTDFHCNPNENNAKDSFEIKCNKLIFFKDIISNL